jgi:uncharacterized protein YdhG (YjbR/CyaY superfamily)
MKKSAAGKKRKRPESVAEYLAGVQPDQRRALEKLRRSIRAALPRDSRFEESISYGIPGVRVDGRMLVWFGANASGCAFYPGGVVGDFAEELAGYDTSKGTIRFSADEPLPDALVRKLVRGRLAQRSGR